MKMLTSKIISFILVLSMILGMGTTAFANGSEINVIPKDIEQGDVIVTDEGVYINGHYYTQGEFIKLLDTAIEIESPEGGITTQSAAALIAGTWWIPGIGEVVITAAGTIIIAGAVIKAGTWLYNKVVEWFQARAFNKSAENAINSLKSSQRQHILKKDDWKKFKKDPKWEDIAHLLISALKEGNETYRSSDNLYIRETIIKGHQVAVRFKKSADGLVQYISTAWSNY